MSSAVAIKQTIKQQWVKAPYYEEAETEASMNRYWHPMSPYRKRFDQLNPLRLLELASGHGRHIEHILKAYKVDTYTGVDINESNIDYCRERVGSDARVRLIVNSGRDLSEVPDKSVTGLFTYASMVHFEYDDVFSYIAEFFRVLVPGGRALVDHSNNQEPGKLCHECKAWRNFMSAELFAHVAMRTGFLVIGQELVDCGGFSKVDCLSFLEKPV